MRDNAWLERKLEDIWMKYFNDVEKLNHVEIHFGRKAIRRLASIRQKSRFDKHSDTEIKVTSYYCSETVPEYVVDVTIAHELCHYVHGFASPLPKFSQYPHRGSTVDNELRKRGLGSLLTRQKKWLKDCWPDIIKSDLIGRKKTVRRRYRRQRIGLFALIKNIVFNN